MDETYKKPEVIRVGTELIYSMEDWKEQDRFLVSTGRTKGRAYVEAMRLYIERERKEGRYV